MGSNTSSWGLTTSPAHTSHVSVSKLVSTHELNFEFLPPDKLNGLVLRLKARVHMSVGTAKNCLYLIITASKHVQREFKEPTTFPGRSPSQKKDYRFISSQPRSLLITWTLQCIISFPIVKVQFVVIISIL